MSEPPAPSPALAVRLLLHGRVQGVGFRYFTRRLARELGIAGRVRNRADGKVEVEAAGDPAALADFRERLREGPPGARVASIEEQELAAVPAWDGFEIDHW
ncbi:MAG TPA: acylphosphatase [Thermoanaerobaculia bacterium]|nr:acylphosphatase [Thermoanaerobaculia bacterium]